MGWGGSAWSDGVKHFVAFSSESLFVTALLVAVSGSNFKGF